MPVVIPVVVSDVGGVSASGGACGGASASSSASSGVSASGGANCGASASGVSASVGVSVSKNKTAVKPNLTPF